jgi:Na+/H+ antiporter NhaD/arsenite permease-like protein
MDFTNIILLTIFLVAIVAIALEHKLEINKSWIALLAGSVMWMIVSVGADSAELQEAIEAGSSEIFGLIVFLIGAMTIVEMMGHYRFFTWLETKLSSINIGKTGLFWIMGFITFVISAILDNLTTTLVMIQIGRFMYRDKRNFLLFVINTVIAANAGGALSPVGDVTTIMLWLAGKFTAWEIVLYGILPSLVAWTIPQALLTRKIKDEVRESDASKKVPRLQWNIIVIGFFTFGFAVMVNLFNLPPFIGILLGLSTVAILIDFKHKQGKLKKKANKIVNVIKTIDMATITFFIGILLAVNALSFSGLLGEIAKLLFGQYPGKNETALIVGNSVIGLISSVFDNVPLTAAVIDMLPPTVTYQYWILLAITAGTGGSILVIGSAAGVAAMGQVPELTVKEYIKDGTLPALLGYMGAILAWYIQTLFLL